MERRDFLLWAGGTALVGPLAGCCIPRQRPGSTAGVGVVAKESTQFARTAFMIRTTSVRARAIRAAPVRIRDVDFDARELMPELRGRLLRAGQPSEWTLLTPRKDIHDRHPWDRAHDLRSGRYAGAESLRLESDDYIEPDLEHALEFDFKRCIMPSAKARAAGPVRIGDPYSTYWPPTEAPFAWHLAKSELSLARADVGSQADRVRVAILDTGYDPAHLTVPEGIQAGAAHDFVEQQAGAEDPGADGVFCNSGHGTATMAILAGKHVTVAGEKGQLFDDFLGGTPVSQVVPVRIADSVLHFFSSAMASGIAYALAPHAKPGEPHGPCDVISISMGGVPSEAWADAVNAVYDAGVILIAAAGNNYGGLPVRGAVWPARFHRAFPVCGATFEERGYVTNEPRVMQGNHGPTHVMTRAIAAYAPNIPWAKWRQRDVIDLDGTGTSSATPQVAAACALWLARHGETYRHNWTRVEAARTALLTKADRRFGEYRKYFGNGVLRARQALAAQPPPQGLREAEKDRVRFPLLEALLEQKGIRGGQQRMYEVEAAQIAARSREIESVLPDWDDPGRGLPNETDRGRALDALISDPFISEHLRVFLEGVRTRKP
jgi:hypothetical protein